MVRSSQARLGEQPALVDQVYDRILAMLLDQTVAPGAPLRTESLAAELGVSPTPVREALARLEPTGLVLRSARQGWSSAQHLTREELEQVVELRLLLEPVNAERACARATPQLLADLSLLVDQQGKAQTGPQYANYKDFLAADWSFHEVIAASTGNPFMHKAFVNFNGYMQRYLFFEHHMVSDAAESTAEHRAVLEAFLAHDPDAAGQAMREHLSRLLERIRQRH